eukprot:1736479-Rhodomonas_salina.1
MSSTTLICQARPVYVKQDPYMSSKTLIRQAGPLHVPICAFTCQYRLRTLPESDLSLPESGLKLPECVLKLPESGLSLPECRESDLRCCRACARDSAACTAHPLNDTPLNDTLAQYRTATKRCASSVPYTASHALAPCAFSVLHSPYTACYPRSVGQYQGARIGHTEWGVPGSAGDELGVLRHVHAAIRYLSTALPIATTPPFASALPVATTPPYASLVPHSP